MHSQLALGLPAVAPSDTVVINAQCTLRTNDGRGSLLVNCAAELAARDWRIAGELRRGLAQIGDVLRAAIAQTQQEGAIGLDTDADVLAQSLLALIAGLRIQAKAGADRRTLQAVARHALEVLLPAAATASEPAR